MFEYVVSKISAILCQPDVFSKHFDSRLEYSDVSHHDTLSYEYG